MEMDLLQRFEAYVASEKKIEPKDWMPDAYRKTLIRQISQHAHSEIVGMLPEGNWISRAPSLKAQGHPDGQGARRSRSWPLSVQCLRNAGVQRDDTIADSAQRQSQVQQHLSTTPPSHWADIGAVGWLVDGAAIMNQVPLCKCSYGPYARAMVACARRKASTSAKGFQIMMTLAQGTRSKRRWHKTPSTAGGGHR